MFAMCVFSHDLCQGSLSKFLLSYWFSLEISEAKCLKLTNGSLKFTKMAIEYFFVWLVSLHFNFCAVQVWLIIVLSGFSRGAYQVRVIAGMIEKVSTKVTFIAPFKFYWYQCHMKVGLLQKGNNEQMYMKYKNLEEPKKAEQFKKTLSCYHQSELEH